MATHKIKFPVAARIPKQSHDAAGWIYDANGNMVCACWTESVGRFDAILNSAEIAARLNAHDDMLRALRRAEEWLEGWASAEPYLSDIRASIASAEAR